MARVHQITDLTTGETTLVPFTADEETARDAEEAAAQQQATAQQTAATERTAATSDLHDQAAAAMTALDTIIARNGTFTLAQAGQAIDAMARIQKRALRLLVAQSG
jgi:hypothetical protein